MQIRVIAICSVRVKTAGNWARFGESWRISGNLVSQKTKLRRAIASFTVLGQFL